MKRPIHWYDYLTFNIYYLGLTALFQTTGIVVPLLVEHFIGPELKGTYFGIYRLWTLMAALLAQALFGMLSDRSRSRWGRRRPFIAAGTLLTLGAMVGVALTAGMRAGSLPGGQNFTGYWLMFSFAALVYFASNLAQSAQQGILPDLVPEGVRGRFSGVKAILELPLALIVVNLAIRPIFTSPSLSFEQMISAGMAATAGVIAVCMLVAMLIPETRLPEAPPRLDWRPFMRLLAMTGAFTLVILGAGWLTEQAQALVTAAQSLGHLMLRMGLAGLLGMALSVGLGVWLSVRISVGNLASRRNPSFIWWVVNRLAFLVGATNLGTFVLYYFQARLGYEKTAAAAPAFVLQLIVGVFILLSALPAGWLSDRFGKKRLLAISGIIGAFGTALALNAPSLPVIYAGGSLLGIATGLFFAANWALGTLLVPKEEAGRYLGISNLAGAGAGAVGAYIGGPIADVVSARALVLTGNEGLGYLLLFAIYGVMFLLSSLALLGVKEPRT